MGQRGGAAGGAGGKRGGTRTKPRRKTGKAAGRPRSRPPQRRRSLSGSLFDALGELTVTLRGEFGDRLRELALETGAIPFRVGRALLLRPENPALAREAGAYLREVRELAGLTRDELSDAIDLEDHSLLKAVEEGTATLSFELILRLAAILARHDPVPFVIRFTRSYNPELWGVLESWGVGRIPLQFEREREFVNIFRRHDAARKLSDEGFRRVLEFTRSAFELSLHFIAEQEHVPDEEVES